MPDYAERTTIGSINVTPVGTIEVRADTVVLRDGVAISPPSYHRHVLQPGDELTDQDPRVVAVAKSIWTPDVMATWARFVAASAPEPAALVSAASAKSAVSANG